MTRSIVKNVIVAAGVLSGIFLFSSASVADEIQQAEISISAERYTTQYTSATSILEDIRKDDLDIERGCDWQGFASCLASGGNRTMCEINHGCGSGQHEN